MKGRDVITRWRRLGRLRQLLLIEAVAALGAAAAAIRLLPFKRAVRLGSRPLPGKSAAQVSPDLAWSVEAAARRVPWRALCFQKALALQWMLRRRGVDARLHYGLAHDPAGELEAHVWVAADGRVIIGGDEATRFRRVATYP